MVENPCGKYNSTYSDNGTIGSFQAYIAALYVSSMSGRATIQFMTYTSMRWFLLVALVFFTLAAHTILPLTYPTLPEASPLPNLSAFHKNIYISRTIERLSPEQKIGQLMFISVPEKTDAILLQSILSSVNPGGMLLFRYNIENKTQTQDLTSTAQQITQNLGLPALFIAVDEEGGIVERIRFDPVAYAAPYLGNADSETLTTETASKTAETLKDLGITVNFAPVADVAYSHNSSMNLRSFGSSPELVAQHTAWSVQTYQDHHILSTVKHFPGHGRSSIDSHHDLPVIDISKEEWLTSDALPFVVAIDAGVPFIMSGHIQFPHIDEQVASRSQVWLEDILRDELGFAHIILSDDIKMDAINTSLPQTAIDALSAGNDMIIAAVTVESMMTIQDALLTYYANPEHHESLTKKLKTILSVKYDYILLNSQDSLTDR